MCSLQRVLGKIYDTGPTSRSLSAPVSAYIQALRHNEQPGSAASVVQAAAASAANSSAAAAGNGAGGAAGATTAATMAANAQGVEVIAIGPLDATATGFLTTQIPALASQNLPAGSTLVMVFTGAFRSQAS